MEGLKDKYQPYFKIGAAVNIKTMESHAELLKTHFNTITCESEMKHTSFCQESGIYRFFWPDRIYEFARKNGMQMHGHVFVKHDQTPQSVYDYNPTRNELLSCLRLHIKVVGNRYREGIKSWDAVNEVIDDKHGLFFRDTPWYRIIGDDYADCIFNIAHEILPDTELYYSDYNESVPEKQEKILKLISGMRSRGVPVHGLSLQSHINIYTPQIDEVKRSLEKYAKCGLKLRISQLDVSMYHFEDSSSIAAPTHEMIKKQAEFYGQLFQVYREYHEVIDSVTFWGIADDATWLDEFPVKGRKNWPLLFDVNHQPKESYYRIMDF